MAYPSLAKLYYAEKERYEAIYQERFHSSYTIHLDFQIHSYPAFFVMDPSFVEKSILLYKTDKKIRELTEILPRKALKQFARRCLIDEIILSNDIEGVYSSRREINSILIELKEKTRGKRYYGLVQKYLMLESGEEIHVSSCEDIRNLYNDLVLNEIKEDNPDNLPDGAIFRKDCASVMSATQKEIHRGVNPESEIIRCMDQALAILGDSSIRHIFRIAIFHYLFGYIHPFYDGNGRTARFISSYLLAKEFEPILGYRISYSIKENIKEYYNAFKVCNDVHNRGDLTPFVMMFLDVVIQSMDQLVEALEKRYHALDHYSRLVYLLPRGLDTKYEALYFVLIQASLFSENGISTMELSQALRVGVQTVASRIKEVADTNLIQKTKIGSKNYYTINLDAIDALSNEKTAP